MRHERHIATGTGAPHSPLVDQFGRNRRMGETRRDAMRNRLLEAALVQYRGENETGHRRLGGDRLLGLAAQSRPDGIDPIEPGGGITGFDVRASRWHGVLRYGALDERFFRHDGVAQKEMGLPSS